MALGYDNQGKTHMLGTQRRHPGCLWPHRRLSWGELDLNQSRAHEKAEDREPLAEASRVELCRCGYRRSESKGLGWGQIREVFLRLNFGS